MILKLLFLAYSKTSGRWCSPYYGSYSSWINAQLACAVDTNCRAVYDKNCDDSGEFHLCGASAYFISHASHCVYKKGK